jgi:hypothetical protein
MIAEFAKEVDALKKALSKTTSININSQVIKDLTIEVSKNFFATSRPYLLEKGLMDDSSPELDEPFQDLLRLTQGNNLKTSYLSKIKVIDKAVKEYAVKDVAVPPKSASFDHHEQALLGTLEAIVPTAALSYRQALIDLSICNHKISFRGTASELRESLRETLDHLAVDKDVMGEQGFKLEPNQTKPTMKQKVRYILKNRSINDTRRLPTEKSVEMVEEIVGQMARAIYNRASLSTHLQTTRQEVIQIKRYIDIVFQEILELT